MVYLARYSAEKNQALAIRAFAQVVREVPQAKLQLYGDGSGKRALQEQVKQLSLEQSISINDFVQDVAAVYESAGLSILTSQGEGFSLVVLESLCHGCPVVACDVNYGPADMIEDGENGALVPFGNEELLAQESSRFSATRHDTSVCATTHEVRRTNFGQRPWRRNGSR